MVVAFSLAKTPSQTSPKEFQFLALDIFALSFDGMPELQE